MGILRQWLDGEMFPAEPAEDGKCIFKNRWIIDLPFGKRVRLKAEKLRSLCTPASPAIPLASQCPLCKRKSHQGGCNVSLRRLNNQRLINRMIRETHRAQYS